MTLDDADWLSFAEASERIARAARPLSSEEHPLEDSLGRALARDIRAGSTLPPWDNSAMDGFAVRAADISGATEADPAILKVIGRIAAGDSPDPEVRPDTAVRIATGAPLPPGADSVVRIEHTEWDGGPRVSILSEHDAKSNIRPRGEDFAEGEIVLEAGTEIGFAQTALLAAAGVARVPVHRSPTVAIMGSGNEVVGADRYPEVRAGRRVPDTGTPGIAAAVRAAGGRALSFGIVPDREEALLAVFDEVRAGDFDLLVTIGGASVGEADLVKGALSERGFHREFWRVRIRPGSPLSFGWLPRSEADDLPGLPVFSLPGNPTSALVTFELFVRPFLRRLGGYLAWARPVVVARAGERLPGRGSLVHFVRVRLAWAGEGHVAVPSGPQGSGLLRPLADADGLAMVPEDRDAIEPGEEVVVRLLEGHARWVE